jgi:hypothetical protein
MCGHPELERDVLVIRRRGSVRQRLELVVTLAGQVVLGIAVAIEVLVGDTHAPDPQRLPALRLGVEPRRDARIDAPELFLAVLAVVVAVVGDAQVAAAGPIPVTEQHRERAEAR